MNKKEYIKPEMQVFNIAPTAILSGSISLPIGEGDATEDACSKGGTLDFDDMDEEW